MHLNWAEDKKRFVLGGDQVQYPMNLIFDIIDSLRLERNYFWEDFHNNFFPYT